MDMKTKISAFCRELEDGELARLASEAGMTADLDRARALVAAGSTGAELENDLDGLNALLVRSNRLGMYPPVTRGFVPLPGAADDTGVQWWTCPAARCVGRGRVKPGQSPPACAATGAPLVPGPFPA
jgi:hypothetical protein